MRATTRRPLPEHAQRHARAFALGLVLLLTADLAPAQAFDLAALMQLLGAARAGEATFVERREVRDLDRPLVSKGRLSFRAPDTFVRETLEPRRERLAISGDTLEMSAGGRRRSVPVDAVPEAGLIVEAIRGTLTGNRASLERLFDARVTGTPDQWWLDLVPREARLRDAVQSVRVGGQRELVREVDVYLAGGDRSYMAIEPTPTHADAPRARP
jgi:hypothetical protein